MEKLYKTEKETFNLAKTMAKGLSNNEVLALIGDLGSGKTTFVKGLASALGIKEHITSPTFVLMKEYEIPGKDYKLHHIDCYRFSNIDDAETIGLSEILNSDSKIVILEWADKVEELLPKNTKKIYFQSKDKGKKIKVE